MTATLFTTRPSTSLSETFDELTAISTARFSGRELAKPCRAFPRLRFAGSFVLSTDEVLELRALQEAGGAVEVPAWVHPVQVNQDGQARMDALFNSDGYTTQRFWCSGAEQVAEIEVSPLGVLLSPLPQGTAYAWPLVSARLADESFAVESRTSALHEVSLAFACSTLDEGETALANPPTALPLPTSALHGITLQSGAASASLESSFDAFDAGHIQLRKLLFTRDTLSLELLAFNRAECIALRTFVRNLRGRANTLSLRHPHTQQMTVWRLASDSTTLEYLTTTTVRASLKFTEVKQ